MQSDAGHEDSVPDGGGVVVGLLEAVGAGAGPGLGLGSAEAENTEASTARATMPSTRARRQWRHRPSRLDCAGRPTPARPETAGPGSRRARAAVAWAVVIRPPRSL